MAIDWTQATPPVTLRPAPVYPRFQVQASLTAGLEASMTGLTGELAKEREWREAIQQGIAWIEVPAIGAFTPSQAPYIQPGWGPALGFVWAVQRITPSALAATDVLQVYRGSSTADVVGQNELNTWTAPQDNGRAWNPGRTGCLLNQRQSLIFTGTLGGGPYYANCDVIQIETWLLPYFLL